MPYLERFTDKAGDLFIKFPLISNLINERGWASTAEANERYVHTAIGKPLTLMFNKEEALFRDYHPFSRDIPMEDKDGQLAFARKYEYGHIVDVSKESSSYKTASGEVPWFAIAKITDPTMAAEWKKPNSRLIPPAFSPGIIQLDGPDDAISKYEILHVASVPSGAFGPKFVALGKCQGDITACSPQLRAATSLENIHAEILSTAEATQFEGEQEEPLQNPVIWQAVIDGRNCGVCERLDGGVFNRDEAERHFPAHEHCRCNLKSELTDKDLLGASYISKRAKRKPKNKKLQAASSLPLTLSYKERCGICPKDVFSSLLLKSGSSSDNNMSFSNSAAQGTPAPSSYGTAEVRSPSGETMATQNTMPQTKKPTLYIKRRGLQANQNQSTEPQPNNNGEQPEEGGEGTGEQQSQLPTNQADRAFRSSIYYKQMQDMKKQLEQRTAQWDYKEKKYQLEKIIKPSLFTEQRNGVERFNQKQWEAEIDKAIKENIPVEWLKVYYQNMEALKQVPELQVKRASSPSYDGLVTLQGASASSLEADEERVKARKALELNGGF